MVILDAVGTGYGTFAGVAPSHAPALLAVLVWPAAIAGRRLIPRADGKTGLAALLLVADAVAHLGLAPGQLVTGTGKVLLFLLDGLLLGGVAVLAFRWQRWRWLALPLLVGNILAYLGFLAAGAETPDEVGVLTKLVELFAVLVCLAPTESTAGVRRSLRWTSAVAALMLLTGINGMGVWVIAIRDTSESHKAPLAAGQHSLIAFAGEVLQPPSTSAPSATARAAAARLVEDTRQGIARYQDVARARADGYRPTTSLTQPTVHFSLQGNHVKGVNPSRPEALVYATTRHGLVLLGAMYEMPNANQRGPDLGGAVWGWHMHNNVCLTLVPFGLLDVATPYGCCQCRVCVTHHGDHDAGDARRQRVLGRAWNRAAQAVELGQANHADRAVDRRCRRRGGDTAPGRDRAEPGGTLHQPGVAAAGHPPTPAHTGLTGSINPDILMSSPPTTMRVCGAAARRKRCQPSSRQSSLSGTYRPA